MRTIIFLLLLFAPILAFAQANVSNDDQQYNGGVSIGSGNTPQGPGTEIVGNGGAAISSFTVNGIMASEGPAPTCGTGCSSIVTTPPSTNTRGSAVGGSSVTSIVVDWSTTLPSAPVCMVSESATGAVLGYSTSTTAITFTLSSALSADQVSWLCMQ